MSLVSSSISVSNNSQTFMSQPNQDSVEEYRGIPTSIPRTTIEEVTVTPESTNTGINESNDTSVDESNASQVSIGIVPSQRKGPREFTEVESVILARKRIEKDDEFGQAKNHMMIWANILAELNWSVHFDAKQLKNRWKNMRATVGSLKGETVENIMRGDFVTEEIQDNNRKTKITEWHRLIVKHLYSTPQFNPPVEIDTLLDSTQRPQAENLESREQGPSNDVNQNSSDPRHGLSFLRKKNWLKIRTPKRSTWPVPTAREDNEKLTAKKVGLVDEYVKEIKAFRMDFIEEMQLSTFYLKKFTIWTERMQILEEGGIV